MPINANLKAQVQARINAADNGSTLEELWNLKLTARGLGCNESNINNLIELRLNEFTASTELKSLLQGALSVRSYAQNIVWKTQTFLTSGTFTRPAKMVGDAVWATGCAAGGSGASTGNSASLCQGGYGGAFCQNLMIPLPSGQSAFSVLIPSGGTGVNSGQSGNPGGDLVFGSLLRLKGGSGGVRVSGTAVNFIDSASLFFGAGIKPLIFLSVSDTGRGSTQVMPADTVNGNISGQSVSSNATSIVASGGAPGFYGNGTAASLSGPSASAGNNTGAGSGAAGASDNPFTGNGGSGRLDLGWWEYE